MNDSNIIEFPTCTASLNENGDWIYKSKPIEPKKKDGTLKKKYKDLPRIKVIYDIEDELNKDYKSSLSSSMKEINAKLIEFSNVGS